MPPRSRAFKSAAIPLEGYLYQNLVGLKLLCDWLDQPSLFEWVAFESDDEETPKGLDDVVARRTDGMFDLYQVKFTVDAHGGKYELSWDWLLARKPKGRSLLQKWCDALSEIGPERVHTAALITNRIPSREFANALDAASALVRLDCVDAKVRTEIEEQLGGVDRAEVFFGRFEFQHSFQGALALERTVADRFVNAHTDRTGWLALFRESFDWAVRHDSPTPAGRISLEVLRSTLDVRRPRPLVQTFKVPEGYRPPNEEFAAEFLRAVPTERSLVVWGSPGQGKSTFLSHVCSELESQGVPFVRHHYFLELGDRSDRFTLASVASSLMAQMEAHHFEHVRGLQAHPEKLRSWIEACASGYREAGKRLVVVVDGLDHVWRENERDKGPLDSLFKALLPVPDNVTLVIGTQKVADAQLPSQFSRFVDASAWRELPRMSLATIQSWLQTQHQAERFATLAQKGPGTNPLAALATAFQQVTGGHPLVLTYTFEALVKRQRILDPAVVRSSALAPDGDIKHYYRTLWQQLPHAAKDALHLLADAGFIWPPMGLETCLGSGVGDLSPSIGHLLHNTDAGQVAFHGSLYAHVRDEPEHRMRIHTLRSNVVEWLRTQAPAFHRWGWLWLYEAHAGDTRNLLERPDRAWVVESLASAYPQDQIEAILGAGEEIAFGNGDFARAIRLRWLKTRLHNGPQFQVDDYDVLQACALQLTEDEYPLKTLASGLSTASVERLHLLGTQYLLSGRTADAVECMHLMRQRINDRIQVGGFDHAEFKAASESFLQLAAGTGEYEPARILAITNHVGPADGSGLLDLFLRELSRRGDLAPLMAFVCLPMSLDKRTELELACLRLAGAIRAKVHEWPEFSRFVKHPLSWCWRLLYQKEAHRPRHFNAYVASLDVPRHTEPPREATQRYLHGLFFATLARCLEQRGAPVAEPTPAYEKRIWLTEAVQQMMKLANTVGGLLSRHTNPAFALPFRLLDAVPVPERYEAMDDYVPFNRALTEVSGDLVVLTALRSGLTKVPSTEWAGARASRHFAYAEWCDRFAGPGLDLLDPDLVGAEVDRQARSTAASVSPFNERAAHYVELCQLATTFELHGRANAMLRRSLACVVGYGWRKDPTIGYVLDVVKTIAKKDRAFATDMLRRLIPAVVRLGDMTEDAGARPSDLASLIATLMPETFPSYYNHWLVTSEWYTAEMVFAELLTTQKLENPAMPLVASAVWDSHAIGALRERAKAGDAHAQALIAANAARFGLPVEELGLERRRSDTPEPKGPDIDVYHYPPEKLPDLLEALRSGNSYRAERRILRTWFEHWAAQGQGIGLLRSLETLLPQTYLSSGITDILDLAFETSLQLEGKGVAYRWLLAAQVHCRGWDEYYGVDDALERFATFARHYKGKWRQFLAETTKPNEQSPQRVLSIPHHRLVHFLLAVDEVQAAKDVVQAMVDTTVEDFSEQPLETPAWLVGATA